MTDQTINILEVERPSLFLIVGLGNPGRNYRNTRHNIGFMVIDKLGIDLSCSLSKVQNKAIIGTCKVGESKVILAKPQTFMNLSGASISSLLKFYKIDFPQLLLIHDDVDVPFGQIRMRPGGGIRWAKRCRIHNCAIRLKGVSPFTDGDWATTRSHGFCGICPPIF